MTCKGITMTRRRLVERAGLAGLTCLPWPSLAAETVPDPIRFTAYRNGSRFGTHTIAFERLDQDLIATVEIAFDYKLAFIPLYRYRHRNREVWRDDRLIRIETETDDNGTDYQLSGLADGDVFRVDGSGGTFETSAAIQPTSYWRESSIDGGEWLDTQRGKIVRSAVTTETGTGAGVDGIPEDATLYSLQGDITCLLWYREGRWSGLRFTAPDDSEIEYRIDPVT